MNISAPKPQEKTAKIESAHNEAETKKAEETKTAQSQKEAVDKKEETKKQESEFKKLLEPQEQTEKKPADLQLISINPNQANNLNGDYINKFGFDVGSISKIKFDYTMNYDSAAISKDDAKFFYDLVENKQFAIQENPKMNIVRFADEIGPSYKTQQVSQTLTSLIEKAYNEGKPVRIDFDNNVSIIMKIDKNGKLSAEFIPGDKAVEEYLRNNIRFLKQRFDEQNLPYNDIFYRQSKNQNQNQRNNKGE